MSLLSWAKQKFSDVRDWLLDRNPKQEDLHPWDQVAAFAKPQRLRGHGYVQGETFDIGINRAKRAIKAIKNKRERKAARTRFIQRLRDSGIK